MFRGYLSFGGNEVVNSERARSYAESAIAPMFWLKGDRSPGMVKAVSPNEQAYDYSEIINAPWYDQTDPDTSGRFYGCYGIDITGTDDSTRTRPILEGIGDGGMLGRAREAVKSVTVSAILVAQGADALEYGMDWLKAVLAPGACGQHGVGCGVTDFQYLVDDPGIPNLVPSEQTPTLLRTNAATDPAATADTAATGQVGWGEARGFGGGTAAGTYAYLAGQVDGPIDELTTYARKTWTVAGGTSLADTGFAAGDATLQLTVAPGDVWTLSGWLRPSVDRQGRVSVYWTDGAGTLISRVDGTNISILPAGQWTQMVDTFTAPAGAVNAQIVMDVMDDGSPAWAVGDTLDGTGLLVEKTSNFGDYFDGNTPDTTDALFAWSGTANNSTSTQSQRNYIYVDDMDEFASRVDNLMRFMHNVGVTSGPFVTSEIASRGFNAYNVEFTITVGRPWVFSTTSDVTLPVLSSNIVEDSPINLIPYPSAELASGTAVAQKNLCTNPSVETNTTGWSLAWGTGMTNMTITTGQSTDIAAAGTYSYKVEAKGNGTASSGTNAQIGTSVDTPITPAVGERFSATIWGALVTSGTGTVVHSFQGQLEWRSASASLGTVSLGTATSSQYAGHVFSARSLVPPAGATIARLHVFAMVDYASSGTASVNSDIKIYADAAAVTNP